MNMEVKLLMKDEFENLRHKVVRYIMETRVRHKPSLKSEMLTITLKKARRAEEKILSVAKSQHDYCERAYLKIARLERRQQHHTPGRADSKGKQAMVITSDNHRIRERLDDVMQNLGLVSEPRSSEQSLYHVGSLKPATISRQKDKFRLAHHQRLKQEDAEDMSVPKLPPQAENSFESREFVWQKVQQLKQIYLSELTNVRAVLIETTKVKLRPDQMFHIVSWLEVVSCIIENLKISKQDLPKRFKLGTIQQLAKQVETTAQVFRDCLPEDCASTNVVVTQSETDVPSRNVRLESDPSTTNRFETSSGEVPDSTRTQGEPSTSYNSSVTDHEPSTEVVLEITRFLLDLHDTQDLRDQHCEDLATRTHCALSL